MFGTTFGKLRSLSPSVRSLLFLCWINAFTTGIIGVFLQIFLYQKFTDISLNVLANLCLYTGILLGFCVPGYVAARFRLNVKGGFMWSFIVTGFAIAALLFTATATDALWVMGLWGFGQGLYWLTLHTLELTEIPDNQRDFYSSVLGSGNQLLGMAGPATATLLIWISGTLLHTGSFTLMFTVAPAIYLLGFFCFSSIKDYHPKPITTQDIFHFFTDRRNQYAQLYSAGTGLQQTLGVTVPPLVILFILGTPLRVGLYDTYFAVFSAVCLLAIAQYRTHENRLVIFGFTTAGLILGAVFFGYFFSFAALIIYTMIRGLLSPLNESSLHVVDLSSMEIGRKESDFYATMLFREVSLWFWRCVGGILFLLALPLFHAERDFLSFGMYLLAAGLAVTYLGAYVLVTKMESFTKAS